MDDDYDVPLAAAVAGVERRECANCKCIFVCAYRATTDIAQCPQCRVFGAADRDGGQSKKRQQEYYTMLEQFSEHFNYSNSALVWLARATSARSSKLAIPKV
jgi:hypothetical protein